MAKFYSSLTIVLALFIIASCAPGTPPTGNDPVYQLKVSVNPLEAGTVTPGTAEFNEGEEVEIAASPNMGWVFDRWLGDYTGNSNPVKVSIDSDKEIVALFIKRDYPLTVNVEGEGTVTEHVIQNKTTDYPNGTTVEITANPASGWQFSHWEGDLDGSSNPAIIEIDSDKNITAVFKQKTYDLTIKIEGEGTVNEEVVEEGKIVKLTASPASGWIFSHWEGDLTGSENPTQIEITAEKEVTAVFKSASNDDNDGSSDNDNNDDNSDNDNNDDNSDNGDNGDNAYYALTVEINGSGSVQKVLQSGNESDGKYESGSVVELTASAGTGWRFDSWSGNVSGNDNPVTIVIGETNNVSASFVRQIISLPLSTEGEGAVSESLISGTSALDGYLFESVVELTANPASGWVFSHWKGGLTGSKNPEQLAITSEMEVTAVFEQENTEFAGGDGSESNPFKVSNVDELQRVADYPDARFIQINDIDANATVTWNGGRGFKPVGSEKNPFRGEYNGGGYEIAGLTINRSDDKYIGLFGRISGAEISNTGLVDASIHGDEQVGGLVGESEKSTISNSYVIGEIKGEEAVGGLAGKIKNGQINKSYARGKVSGEDETGGLAGINEGGQISNSYARSTVSGEDEVGGLVGSNKKNGRISHSYASGSVSGDDETGGFIGKNEANVESCYWDKEASGRSKGAGKGSSGGITGLSTSEMTGNSAESNMPAFNWSSVWTTSNGYPVLQSQGIISSQ